jgi:hypothetical protein
VRSGFEGVEIKDFAAEFEWEETTCQRRGSRLPTSIHDTASNSRILASEDSGNKKAELSYTSPDHVAGAVHMPQ